MYMFPHVPNAVSFKNHVGQNILIHKTFMNNEVLVLLFQEESIQLQNKSEQYEYVLLSW